MIFAKDFFDTLPTDPIHAIKRICDAFFEYNNSIGEFGEQPISDYYDEYTDAFAALEAYLEINNLMISFSLPSLGEFKSNNVSQIVSFYRDVFTTIDTMLASDALESSRFKYKAQFGSLFSYKFSDGDLNRIQELINELRDLISTSELFEPNHRERLLLKIENMQKELHKKMSNVDKFWGLIGDAGIVLGKFGKDAKPFVDRIKEISEIVWRTQAAAEELPSGTSLPLLKEDN